MRVELRPMEPLASCLDLMQLCLAINTPIIPPDMLSTSLRMVSPLPRLQDQAYQAHRELHQRRSHRTRTQWFHRVHIVSTQGLPLVLAPASRGQSLGRRRRMTSS